MAVDPDRDPAAPGRTWESDVVLADGGTMRVRPIRPDDAERLVRFHDRQSPESIYYRYFSPRPRLTTGDVERLTRVDGIDRMAFVGLINDEMVGVARYDRHPTRAEAEVALFTDDSHAGRGMATVLLEYLAAAARHVGISRFTAQVLPDNRRMLSVFKQVGFAVNSRFSDGVIEVEFPIEPTPEALAAMEERAQRAEARSVARILNPRSVAVIGASRRPDSLGQAVFRRLLAGGFEGPVYPVNSEAEVVASVRAHPSILAIPDEIDLAVVVVPADQVPDVVEQCGRKRVRGLVVVSAGFSETGPEGAARERALVAQARRLGLRLIGPNAMGVVNTGVSLVATFAAVAPRPGRVAVSSQSGTIGAAVLRRLDQLGLGVSSFVATGNRADVSSNDLLRYWETDEATDVVLLYLESFGNPRNFARITRRIGRAKPVVAVKAGAAVAAQGQGPGPLGEGRAGAGDDGASSDDVTDMLFAQTGVVRVDTLDQLFDVTRVLASQPLPAGGRVAVLSNFWGPAVLAADACVAAGLELAAVGADVARGIAAELLPPGTRIGNPFELTSDAGPAHTVAVARALLAAPGVDALLVVHAPPLDGRVDDVVAAVEAAALGSGKPVVASFLGAVLPGDRPEETVPAFAFPEAAAYALGRVARYADWRARQTGSVPDLEDVDAAGLAAASAALVADGGGGRVLALDDALALLGRAGIRPVAQREVRSPDAAVAAAEDLGWPVALKARSLDRPSRTEEGGVAVDLFDDVELRRSYARMADRHGPGMLVQAMAPTGTDVRVEVSQHPVLGPVLALGPAGGAPWARRVLPLTDVDAAEMVAAGPPTPDPEALVDLLLRLAAVAAAAREVSELRFDPVIVSPGRAAVTDVRLAVTPWATDPEVRRLA